MARSIFIIFIFSQQIKGFIFSSFNLIKPALQVLFLLQFKDYFSVIFKWKFDWNSIQKMSENKVLKSKAKQDGAELVQAGPSSAWKKKLFFQNRPLALELKSYLFAFYLAPFWVLLGSFWALLVYLGGSDTKLFFEDTVVSFFFENFAIGGARRDGWLTWL